MSFPETGGKSQADLSPVVLFVHVVCECGETQGLQSTAD